MPGSRGCRDSNGVFERGNRLVQIGRLPIEEGFAFLALFELFERGQIDRAQFADLIGDAGHLPLQPGGARRFVETGLQRGYGLIIERRLGQHLLELFGIEARSLFLQLQIDLLLA